MKDSTNNNTLLTKNIITRLAKYLRILKSLKSIGLIKVFSSNLGDAAGIAPTVVRKDFSILGINGNKKGGYIIDNLIKQIEGLLGIEDEYKAIIVGCGRIGKALIESEELKREHIHIIAGFDLTPSEPLNNVPIYTTDKMEEIVKKENIKIGIISVPNHAAIKVFEHMREAGIRGFLNFTSVDIKCGDKCPVGCEHKCVINQVNIGLELENLFHLVHITEKHPDLLIE
ncbi:redox-sensing transcriptional repressor Rex [Spirochaetia bacterium 38H-sp]|uniref:Redox-sensing transcriptional repressor Rex n=1 Tax=Rarispira pelagica TaxID=3141764 RepID=A0ABU9UEQ7_9SPIR